MKQIKFRAWNLSEKKWTTFGTCIDSKAFEVGGVFKPFRDVVIQQFTSLEDKNGKEIYEGDVLRWKESAAGIVEFVAPSFRVRIHGYRNLDPFPVDLDFVGLEVIGNIYENPNLLH